MNVSGPPTNQRCDPIPQHNDDNNNDNDNSNNVIIITSARNSAAMTWPEPAWTATAWAVGTCGMQSNRAVGACASERAGEEERRTTTTPTKYFSGGDVVAAK